jgi:hypothetical protein
MNHYQNDMNNMAWMFILIQRVYTCFLVIYYIERDTCCDVMP